MWFLDHAKQIEQIFLSPSCPLIQLELYQCVSTVQEPNYKEAESSICIKGFWPDIGGMLSWDL